MYIDPMQEWNYQQFLAFVLLYAANSDQDVKTEELSLIEKKVGNEALTRARQEFEKLSDHEIIDLIVDQRDQFFADEQGRDKILADVQEVYEADHNYSLTERNTMMMLKKIIR